MTTKKRSQKAFIGDILECIQRIELYIGEMTKSEFWKNTQIQDAVTRREEIIGEAAKNVFADFKKRHPEIPWKDISGMRDILTHDYFGINLEKVWKTAKEDLPPLKKQIEAILKEGVD